MRTHGYAARLPVCIARGFIVKHGYHGFGVKRHMSSNGVLPLRPVTT